MRALKHQGKFLAVHRVLTFDIFYRLESSSVLLLFQDIGVILQVQLGPDLRTVLNSCIDIFGPLVCNPAQAASALFCANRA